MELICRLEVVNRQGGAMEYLSRGSIIIRNMNNRSTPSEEPFIIVRTWPNTAFKAKYNLIGNIEALSTEFLNQGRATVCLKEPSYNITITKADPDELTAFIVYFKKQLPVDAPVHVSTAAFEPPTCPIKLYLGGQEEYKLSMENVIGMKINMDQFTDLYLSDCILELAGYQLPIAGAIRNMKNLTTLQLISIELRSSTFLEIESKELKRLNLRWCKTQFPIASLFKNDLCYKDSLVELRLDENRWTEIPNGIFQFQNLLKLSLRINNITELPEKFTNLPKLQELDLSHNEIRHVPSSIFALQNLSKLDLRDNLITELPDIIKLPKLEMLLLAKNQLGHLPPSIFALQNLLKLSLRKNYITELPDKFTNLPKLMKLSLDNNQLRYLPPSILSLNLKELYIADNEFNFEIPPSVGHEMLVHSLKELSYRTILNHKFKVEEGMLPKKFLKDLENHHQCVCGCKFVDEGQDLLFFCNLNVHYDISSFIFYNSHRHLRVPIRGKMCTSLKSCFLNHFTMRK